MEQSQIRQYVLLMQVVAMAADQDKVTDLHRYWVFGFRALVDIYYGLTAETKTLRLPLTDGNIVKFPSDYVKWVKVGIMGEDGKVITLIENNDITTYRDKHPERLSKLTANVHDCNYFANYLEFDQYVQLPVNNNSGLSNYGEFKVDEDNRVVVFPPSFQYRDCMFEFIFSPKKDKTYMVEQISQEAIIAFIRAKAGTGSMNEYYAELSSLRRKLDPIRKQTIEQAIRTGHGWKING